MANPTRKGFRIHSGEGKTGTPATVLGRVASNYGTALSVGQPVRKTDAGYYELAPGTEGTPGLIFGIIAAIDQFYDSNLGRISKPLGSAPKTLPASTTYTGVDNESRILIWPCQGNYFEVDADAALSTATRAGALALLGTNGDHVISSDDAALDISDVETNDGSATSAQWNLVNIVEYPDTDFTASRLKFVVKCIEVQNADGSTGL